MTNNPNPKFDQKGFGSTGIGTYGGLYDTHMHMTSQFDIGTIQSARTPSEL
jgi:hypothetical protein